MELMELARVLNEQDKKGSGFQIHLNSGCLDITAKKCTGVEFGDLYFTECSALNSGKILCFGNMNRNPINQRDDGTNIYPMEINNSLFIDVTMIGTIEEIENFEDWFDFPSTKVINIYMLPEDDRRVGNRNIITIGFMK